MNIAVDDTISEFTRSDQLLFTHPKKKLILNSILEAGFYEFCKYRLKKVAESDDLKSEEVFLQTMEIVQGEIELLAYLIVNARLAHRTLNFDLFLSLLKGGLFFDIMQTFDKIVKDMEKKAESVNRETIQRKVKVIPDNIYI